MWPFTKRKRREAEQDAEYQAFLAAHQNKTTKPIVRARVPPKPTGNWNWNDETRQAHADLVNGVNRAYQGSAVSYGPVDELAISCIPAVHLHDRYPDQAND